VGSSKTDAVWVYALNYGGGIVSVSFVFFLFHCLGILFLFAYDGGFVLTL